MTSAAAPAPAASRLELVDSLRGFALLGVFWANLLIFAGIAYMSEAQRAALLASPVDALAYSFERFFIENKFMGLFSFLFGVSFWLFISSARSRGVAGTPLFYRRISWLLVIGLLHGGLLWCFDVLRFYALWAVLLPLLVETPPARLRAFALGCAVPAPAIVAGVEAWLGSGSRPATDFDAMALAAFSSGSYRDVLVANLRYDGYLTFSVGQVAYQIALFGRLALGVYAARTLDLGDPAGHRALLRRLLLLGGLAGAVGNGVFAGDLLAGDPAGPLLAFARRLLVEGGFLGLTLFYVSGLALAFLEPRWRSAVSAFAPVGRMALTWYLFQTVFGVWLCYGFAPGPGLMGELSATPLAVLAGGGFALQVVLARAWLSRFRFGPAEWLWRTATYWKIQPILADRG